jgi:hypothetical protein
MTILVALCVLTGSWATRLVFYSSALEMLGLHCRRLMFLMGKSISSIVMVFSLKSKTATISSKVCLLMIKLYPVMHFPEILDIWLQMHQLASRVLEKGEFDIAHQVSCGQVFK